MTTATCYLDRFFSGFECANLTLWETELESGILIIQQPGHHAAHLAGIRAEMKRREVAPELREPMDSKYEPNC